MWLLQEYKHMAKNNNVYYEDALKQCGLDEKYIYSLKAIIDKDSPGKTFKIIPKLLDAKCIDMDMIEVDNLGNNDKTMDLVIGLADFDDVRQVFTNYYLLPVELKLNCVEFNLKLEDLKTKDQHTRDYHLGTYSKQSVFLFTDKVYAHAVNNYSRWKRGSGAAGIKNWVIMNPSQFCSFIRFADDFPYVPQTDFNVIAEKIDKYIEENDINGCCDYIDGHVKALVNEYAIVMFNRNESLYIYEELEKKMDEVYRIINNEDLQYMKMIVKPILDMAKI